MYINISYTRPAPARFRGHHAPKLDDTSWGSGVPIGKSGKCYENGMNMVSKNALGQLCIVGSYSPNGSAEVLEKAMERARERLRENNGNHMYITFIHEDFDVTNHWNTGFMEGTIVFILAILLVKAKNMFEHVMSYW